MPMSDFAKRVSEMLAERKATKADLSRETGIPYHRLNPWFIRKNAMPNGGDLLAVAFYFQTTEEYLLHGTGPRHSPTDPVTAELVRDIPRLSLGRKRALLGVLRSFLAESPEPENESQDGDDLEAPE